MLTLYNMDGPKVMNSMQQQQQDVIKESWAYRHIEEERIEIRQSLINYAGTLGRWNE